MFTFNTGAHHACCYLPHDAISLAARAPKQSRYLSPGLLWFCVLSVVSAWFLSISGYHLVFDGFTFSLPLMWLTTDPYDSRLGYLV